MTAIDPIEAAARKWCELVDLNYDRMTPTARATLISDLQETLSAYEAEKAKQSAPDDDGWRPWGKPYLVTSGETYEVRLANTGHGTAAPIAYRVVKP